MDAFPYVMVMVMVTVMVQNMCMRRLIMSSTVGFYMCNAAALVVRVFNKVRETQKIFGKRKMILSLYLDLNVLGRILNGNPS